MKSILSKEANYGWPVVTWELIMTIPLVLKETKPGIENPIYYWLPSIAPSGMTFVTSDKYRVERTFTSRFIKISVSRS
jgi:glucose/arabinose dehydrogenase